MRLADALEEDDAGLAAQLTACGVELAQLEASVRGDALRVRSARMMIERAQPGVLEVLLSHFTIPRAPVLDALLAFADAHGLPRIAGWDAHRGCVKLYVNASDADDETRERLGARFDVPAAHVLGVNVFADRRVETKRYTQHRSAGNLGVHVRRLADAAGARCAGVVLSRHADDSPHAYFVALRPGPPEDLDEAFGWLPGFSSATIAQVAPFAPASPRSLGIAATVPLRWTVYVKARAVAEPELWSLEPRARFIAGEVELALYVAPVHAARRAYAIVGEQALSYRVVRGAPGQDAIEALMRWAAKRLPEPLDAPPAPWSRAPRG